MSLKSKEFLLLRKKAMTVRKDKFLKKSGSEVTTIAEIAAKLKETPMVRGMACG